MFFYFFSRRWSTIFFSTSLYFFYYSLISEILKIMWCQKIFELSSMKRRTFLSSTKQILNLMQHIFERGQTLSLKVFGSTPWQSLLFWIYICTYAFSLHKHHCSVKTQKCYYRSIYGAIRPPWYHSLNNT